MDFMKVFDQAVREIKREVNLKVLKVPEIEQKVLDATNEEPWGPHGSAMAEIANATRKSSDYHMVMGVLWKRIAETGSDWRHVYKALTVLEYLVAHGSERVLDDIQEHSYQLSALSSFSFVEPSGKDQGINVRKKSQSLMSLLSDKQKIQEVRKKAAANKDKYGGLSSTGGYKPSSYSSFDSGFQNDSISFRSRNGNDEDKYGSGDRYGDKYSSKYGNRSQYGTNGSESSGRERGKYRGDDDDDFESLRGNKDVQYSAMSEPNDTSRTQGNVGTKDEKLNKQNISSTSPYTDDDFDDFDPRGNTDDFNPRGTTATGAVTSSLIGTDDLLGTVSPKVGSDFTKSASSSASVAFSSFIPPPPSAASPFTAAKVSPLPQTTDFFSTSALPAGNNSNGSVFSGVGESNLGIDLFGSTNLDTSLKTPVTAPKSGNQLSNDFFSQTSYDTSLSSHQDILSADFPSNATSSEPLFPFTDEEPATVTSKVSNSTANIVNTYSSSSNGSYFDAFGNTSSSEASDAQTHSSDVFGIAKTQPAKEKFQPKSSIWADTLSRGLIDLDLSESKATASLVDIGIVLDPSAPEKKKEVEPKQPVATRGKAMGSGSGLGRLGASSLSFNASTFGSFESSRGSSTFGMEPTAGKVDSVGLGAGLGVVRGSPTIGMNSERNIGMKTTTGSSFPMNYAMGPSQGGLDNNTQQFGRFS